MLVYGQIVKAALENSASSLSGTVTGLMAWNTTGTQMEVSDGTNVRAMLRNDLKAIIGNNGTANNNIRFHRGAAGVLQFLQGGDATAEGTLSANLNQISGRIENYTTGSLPAAANAGRLLYDTTLNFVKFDTGADIKTLASLDGVQSISNKELVGGTASDSLRWQLPSETTANLGALTDLAGLIAYDTTLNAVVFNNGSGWATIDTAAGGMSVTSVKTANYTAAINEIVRTDPSGGAFTVTLPTAVGQTGNRIKIQNITGVTTWNIAMTIDGDGSETIGGLTTFPIYTAGEALELVSDGSNWLIVTHIIPSNRSTAAVHTPGAVTTAPTEASAGVTHNSYYYERQGRYLVIVHDYRASTPTGGTNGSGTYLWTLPQSLQCHADVKSSTGQASSGTYTGYSVVGSAGLAFNSATVNNADIYPIMHDATRFALLSRSGNSMISSSHIGWVNGAGTIGYTIRARILIDGWLG